MVVEALACLATDIATPVIFTTTPLEHPAKRRYMSPAAAHRLASSVAVAGDVTSPSLRTQTAVIAISRAVIGRFPT